MVGNPAGLLQCPARNTVSATYRSGKEPGRCLAAERGSGVEQAVSVSCGHGMMTLTMTHHLILILTLTVMLSQKKQ